MNETPAIAAPPRWLAVFTRFVFLSSFAVAAPLFALADLHPDYFTHYHCDRGDILAVTAFLFLGPPVLLFLLVRLCGRRIGRAPEALFTWLLTVTLLGLLLDLAEVQAARWHLPAACAAGAALTPFILKLPRGPRSTAVLAGASLLVPLHFLNLSTVSVIFFGGMAPHRAPPAMKNPVPVVIVILDELPLPSLITGAGQIDGALFPGFARLASRATWYRNATTVDPYTFGAIPAMLTGNFALPFEPPSSAVYPDSVFSLFENRDVEAFEFSTRMLPVGQGTRRRYQSARLDRLVSIATDVSLIVPLILTGDMRNGPKLAEVSQRFKLFTGQKLFFGRLPAPSEYFEEFIRQVPEWSQSGLYYFHNHHPHPPWHLLPGGTFYESNATAGYDVTVTPVPRFPGKALQEMTWTDDPFLVQQGYQRHLFQTMYADHQLTRLFDAMERARLFDRAMVIVTSDHGAFYGAGRKVRGYVGPGVPPPAGAAPESSVPYLYCIPLFIKYPGQSAGVVSDANVEHIDLLPTIADVLGVEVPWKLAGRSLLSRTPERPTKHAMTALAEPVQMPREITTRNDAAGARRAWFEEPGSGDAFPWVYRPRPYGAHVGQPLAGIAIAEAPDVTVVLDGSRDRPPPWAGPGTGGSVKGCVTSPRLAEAPFYLAIAHGGRIVAVTRVAFPKRETSPFLALFPESVDGRDPGLTVFVVTSPPGAPLTLARPASVTRAPLDACYTLPSR